MGLLDKRLETRTSNVHERPEITPCTWPVARIWWSVKGPIWLVFADGEALEARKRAARVGPATSSATGPFPRGQHPIL
jgi:hypothetical protein